MSWRAAVLRDATADDYALLRERYEALCERHDVPMRVPEPATDRDVVGALEMELEIWALGAWHGEERTRRQRMVLAVRCRALGYEPRKGLKLHGDMVIVRE